MPGICQVLQNVNMAQCWKILSLIPYWELSVLYGNKLHKPWGKLGGSSSPAPWAPVSTLHLGYVLCSPWGNGILSPVEPSPIAASPQNISIFRNALEERRGEVHLQLHNNQEGWIYPFSVLQNLVSLVKGVCVLSLFYWILDIFWCNNKQWLFYTCWQQL